MAYKGKRALSLNAYIYRPSGILIGYFLCGRCGNKIHKAAERNPLKQIPLHKEIEKNLAAAYRRQLH